MTSFIANSEINALQQPQCNISRFSRQALRNKGRATSCDPYSACRQGQGRGQARAADAWLRPALQHWPLAVHHSVRTRRAKARSPVILASIGSMCIAPSNSHRYRRRPDRRCAMPGLFRSRAQDNISSMREQIIVLTKTGGQSPNFLYRKIVEYNLRAFMRRQTTGCGSAAPRQK